MGWSISISYGNLKQRTRNNVFNLFFVFVKCNGIEIYYMGDLLVLIVMAFK